MTVTVKAWCRVDLAGGTLDIWPLGLFHPQARTVNVAIDLAVAVGLRRLAAGYRVLPGGERGRGPLGRRSWPGMPEAALIGVAAEALDLPPFEATPGERVAARRRPRRQLRDDRRLPDGGRGGLRPPPLRGRGSGRPLARDLEARLMGLPTGMQDHYPALLGGALEIRPLPGGERVRRAGRRSRARSAASLVVVYSGQSHFSAGNNWQVVRRRLEGEPEVTGPVRGDRRHRGRAGAGPRSGGPAARGGADEPRVELPPAAGGGDLDAGPGGAARRPPAAQGAWGGKACGAGGGGCLAILGPPERRRRDRRGAGERGGKVLRGAARPGWPLEISFEADL